MGAIPVDI